MSYYIAPQANDIQIGEIVIYRVVKRLSDFKPEEGKKYRVFSSKKERDTSLYVPLYIGSNGRLVKCNNGYEFVLRF